MAYGKKDYGVLANGKVVRGWTGYMRMAPGTVATGIMGYGKMEFGMTVHGVMGIGMMGNGNVVNGLPVSNTSCIGNLTEVIIFENGEKQIVLH